MDDKVLLIDFISTAAVSATFSLHLIENKQNAFFCVALSDGKERKEYTFKTFKAARNKFNQIAAK